MKLLFINQYYWPDMAATSQMMSDLCEHLAAHGHEVHVLCSRGKYDDGTHEGLPPRYEVRNGVHIHRVTATGFGKRSMLGRIADYASFHLLIGIRTLLSIRRYDAVITLTTPPLIGLYAAVSPARHICWVMDLHPDCEFELGVFKRTSLLPRLLDWLNGLHFRRSRHCVVLGPHMARRLEAKGVKPDQLAVIPVWGHDLTIEDSTALRAEWGLEGKFVLMYSGNAGLIHTFDAICEAALMLRDDSRFAFLFVGGGKRADDVRRFKEAHDLPNIQVRGYVPREQLGQSLTMADAHLITLRDGMAGVAVPCKLYGILAASRPALFVGPAACETADTIHQHDCGRTFATSDAQGIVNTLRELADNSDLGRRLGHNARTAFEQSYNKHACCEQWRKLLEA